MKSRRIRRSRAVAGAVALALLAAALTWTLAADDPPAVHRSDHRITGAGGAVLDASLHVLPGGGRRPAVLLAHGFGGSKDGESGRAEHLARAGYTVLTWSARGFGASGGRIGLNAPDAEVADVSRLLDWLAVRPEVRLDGTGDPVAGMTGASYGGALTLLAAAADDRIDAIVPRVGYWDLNEALFPQGVFKRLWAGVFFGQGLTDPRDPQCGRFTPEVCAAFQRSAVSGRADARTRDLLRTRSPAAYAERISVPALLVQGQTDSLFPLDQSDAMARALARGGAPVAVDWVSGGHDSGDEGGEGARTDARTAAWFDAHLRGDGSGGGPAFRISRAAGTDAQDGTAVLREVTGDRYPGLGGTERRTLALDGGERTLARPAGGTPPAVTAVPGLGALSRFPGALGQGPALGAPVHSAVFTGPPLDAPLQMTGAPSVDLTVRAEGEAVLFATLYDVAPDGGQSLPRRITAPVRVAAGGTARVALPALDHRFEAGHRLRVVVSATDLGFATPAEPAVFRLRAGELAVPVVPELRAGAAGTLPWWIVPLPVAALGVAAALLLSRRPGRTPAPDPALAEVLLTISGLTKRYRGTGGKGAGGGYAVRDLSFTVGRGQVVGLLGPNGAGKTTTLRMLMGLIRPDAGELRIYGHPVRPGAPVLSRLGSFVEGAGFLPHLTGRQNLDLYWRATGRPAADAHTAEALAVAGLGPALDRAVRTYSQGMRQRLAVAQAMLGLPDLLVLDEPTNGLDPAQIREMRAVLTRYAAGGRSVVVSSHLLAEVEQCCTHLVVMNRGELIAAGPVAEITGGDRLLVATAAPADAELAAAVAALPGVGDARATGEGLLVRLDGMAAPELLAELVRRDVAVAGAGPYGRLEDAFLALIGGAR
ncbi:alpha/beta fold hydrolase [Streptomyces sp. NPDC005805]|uniref:alpha/beta fold hydrolase n=1 Tax=Streptomyces sp. NPDC005805 TaxID=3157068 RepID=UPI003404A662